MLDLEAELVAIIQSAMHAALPIAEPDPVLRPASRPGHGDFQVNGALPLAKTLGRPARDVAAAILKHLPPNDAIGSAEVAGPGFINLHVRNDYLSLLLDQFNLEDSSTFRVNTMQRVVIDYSSPNVAKEMHVGHLRSTIIGDALARILTRLGHQVIRQNHLGDWGTQFGMLVEHYDDTGEGPSTVQDLNVFYKRAKEFFDTDSRFADRARMRVVQLQAGDPQTLDRWRTFVGESQHHMEHVYAQLDVLLQPEDVRGESFYNNYLPFVVRDLTALGLTQMSDGAMCIFMDEFRGPDGAVAPMIIQKRDGGFNYATTDLAALRYRITHLHADRLIYVVDARQARHFEMLFAAARRAGWLPTGVEAVHVHFGTVLGDDGRPFKTRSGETIRLTDLLDEAVSRARAKVDQSQPDLSSDERAQAAEYVGIGAVKFADLSSHRTRDYVFSWERMLALQGATGPYVQYACTRLHSILRRADAAGIDWSGTPLTVRDARERRVAILLGHYQAILHEINDTLEPHTLCGYLADLATACTAFYENCPILRENPPIRNSRLALSALSAKTLSDGLSLLGIHVPERM